MTNPISLVHLTEGTCPPPRWTELAAEAGFDAVSFRGIPARGKSFPTAKSGTPPFDFAGDAVMRRETKKALQATGLSVNDIENARIYDGVDILAYQKDLEAAAELGCKQIITNIWSSDLAEGVDAFSRLCEMASAYGLSIHLEFVTWSSVKDLKAARDFLKKSGCSNIGIVVDTLHWYRSRVTLEELKETPMELFSFGHLCDGPPEIPESPEVLASTAVTSRDIPGRGKLPLEQVVRAMPARVTWGLEVPNPGMIKELGLKGYLRRLQEETRALLERIWEGGNES